MADTERFSNFQTHSETAEKANRRDAILLDRACNFLSNNDPLVSARYGLSAEQRSGLFSLLGAAFVFTLVVPAALYSSLLYFFSLCFLSQALLRFCAVGLHIWSARKHKDIVDKEDVSKYRSDRQLPSFSILIPVYKEANVVAQSVRAMAALDYPPKLVEVIYLVEADDPDTFDALSKCRHLGEFRIVTVPSAPPRTKPKALNYGLGYASGDIITVFDAEDIPAPQQLNIVVDTFAASPENVAVLQAELRAYNNNSGWIASQFSLEYAMQFLVWMPFIAKLNWPLNLGGTSNHFRAEILRQVGAWDPYNVTEDADLGLRLAAKGYIARMIPTFTLEEAPVHLTQWIRQRSRWIKGHLTTWLVHMRHSRLRLKQLGFFGYCGLQFTFALSILSNFFHAPLLCWTIWQMASPDRNDVHPLFLSVLVLSLTSVIAAAITAPIRMPKWIPILTFPVYWPLMSVAAALAVWEMHVRPHSWSKTPHGLCPPPNHTTEN